MKTVWQVATVALLIVIAILFYNNIQLKGTLTSTYKLVSDTTQYFETYVDDLGRTISKQGQRIATQEQAIQSGLVNVAELEALNIKYLASIASLEEKIGLKDTVIKYVEVPVIIDVDGDEYLKIPIPFAETSKWFNINGDVTKGGVAFRDLSFISSPKITIGYQKEKWYKKKTPEIFYSNESPYVTLKTMDNIIIKEPKKWYETNIFFISLGAVGTAIILNL